MSFSKERYLILPRFGVFAGSTNHRNTAIMNGGDTRHHNHHPRQRFRENPRLQLPSGGGKCPIFDLNFMIVLPLSIVSKSLIIHN